MRTRAWLGVHDCYAELEEPPSSWPQIPRSLREERLTKAAAQHGVHLKTHVTPGGRRQIAEDSFEELRAKIVAACGELIAWRAEVDRADRERGFGHPLVTVTDHPGVLVPPGGGVISAGREPG